jgi:hypothetical protein
MTDKELKKYVKDRDEAILSFDIEQMRKFCKKYQDILANIPPDDEIMYAGFMKCVADIRAATTRDKKKAARWLIEHGYGVRCY